METLETRELLGYTIETFDLQEFKEYYDENKVRFSDFSRSAFLKAISIPPAYFLEQPEETQNQLLINKTELSQVAKKYQGQSVLVVSQGNSIINACKIKTEDIEIRFEQLSSIEDVEGIVWDRTFHKDGYVSGYLVFGHVNKEGYNKSLFVDLPLLLNKPAQLHEGFVELANPNMEVEKDMMYYESSYDVDFYDYQHIKLAIEDKLESLGESVVEPIGTSSSQEILREPIDVICQLVDAKVAPKALVAPLVKYLGDKQEEGQLLTTDRLVRALITFDNNVKSLKLVNALRDSKEIVNTLFVTSSNNEESELALV